ncbi:TonB-dependent receptor [Methyloglobulus morosus KoM1]|uniref:TonB-dependent receptor n=1 Tax=Methyloglobulus morosus KoM1 TaxID=1116472 RepID=V5BTV2_9GAMM|nr:TonB-dependent receptor [Methyloglobulus morosus]ESS71299.1 TonB-dependent receptor [Methyloglobulus morosus KoM1]
MKHRFVTICFLLSNALVQIANADDLSPPQQLEEVVVYGNGLKQATAKSARPMTVLDGEALRTKVGQTIGDTLSNELGITSQSFGAGVGTPVIRGQSGSRVRVMQNSIGNNDASNLSPDHANGVDPIIAERVEVLRGPSTLLYGNGAIGGIVNVIDNRIPESVPDKVIGGAGEQRYNSVSDETSSALKLEGGKSGFAYHLDGFYRDQGNTHIGGLAIDEAAVRQFDPSFNSIPIGQLQNSDGVIDNTQARSRGGSVGLTYIGDAGLAGAATNHLDKVYGIAPNGKGGEPVTINLKQTKYDFKAQLNQPFTFAQEIRMKLGYTDYRHDELDGRQIGATFLNKSFESRLELEHLSIGKVKGTVGFQSVNSVFEGLGEGKNIVPKSNIDSYALFAVESLAVGKVKYELGGRVEGQTVAPENRNSLSYIPVSASASALWDIADHHQVSLAFTHSQRAPQVQELLTNGFHDATRSFERGNVGLSKELSNNLDLGYRFNSDWVTAEINLFQNWVGDYIYQQRSSSQLFNDADGRFVTRGTGCAGCFPVLGTQQADAMFKGFEAQTIFPLMQNKYGALDLTLFGDYTRGTFDRGGNVPRMPPLRYGLQLSYEKDGWSGNVRLTRGEAQKNAGANETNTDGYLLLNVGCQYRLADFQGTEITFFAKGKNLLNENIRNSTSYLRNFAPEPGRGVELGLRVSY